MKRFGRLSIVPVEIPARELTVDGERVTVSPAMTYGKPVTEDGTPWNDVCAKVKVKPDTWFIAVGDNGWIHMAEQDPTMIAIADVDILAINHPGGHDDIIAHRWTGKTVEDWS